MEIKIKRSLFISSLHRADSISEAKSFISQVSAEHKTANHNCWAYIIGDKGKIFHSSDAGEPGGSAGLPMLHTLQKFEMTNIAAVVTRYFGGVKLGISGLMNAYSSCIEQALLSEPLQKLIVYSFLKISTTYDFMEILKHQIRLFGGIIIDSSYSENVMLEIKIDIQTENGLVDYLKEMENTNRLTIL
jgi:uncharacterized YigZ family protein